MEVMNNMNMIDGIFGLSMFSWGFSISHRGRHETHVGLAGRSLWIETNAVNQP